MSTSTSHERVATALDRPPCCCRRTARRAVRAPLPQTWITAREVDDLLLRSRRAATVALRRRRPREGRGRRRPRRRRSISPTVERASSRARTPDSRARVDRRTSAVCDAVEVEGEAAAARATAPPALNRISCSRAVGWSAARRAHDRRLEGLRPTRVLVPTAASSRALSRAVSPAKPRSGSGRRRPASPTRRAPVDDALPSADARDRAERLERVALGSVERREPLRRPCERRRWRGRQEPEGKCARRCTSSPACEADVEGRRRGGDAGERSRGSGRGRRTPRAAAAPPERSAAPRTRGGGGGGESVGGDPWRRAACRWRGEERCGEGRRRRLADWRRAARRSRPRAAASARRRAAAKPRRRLTRRPAGGGVAGRAAAAAALVRRG